jgi:aspartyl protease family protein
VPLLAAPSPVRTRAFPIAALLLSCALAGAAAAIDVQVVAVSPGSSADVTIDGIGPITIGVGETIEGVTVVSADRRGAVVRVGGATKTLPLVAYRAPSGGGGAGSGGEMITLRADPSGHFLARGSINGKPVHFLVDTGATTVAICRADAERLGIDFRRGRPVIAETANGLGRGWRVRLASVSIGGTTVNDIEADVTDSSMSVALLGMTFLNHFDMQRQGPILVLRRR